MRIHSGLLLSLAPLLAFPAAGARFPTPDAAHIAFAVDGLRDANNAPAIGIDANGGFVVAWYNEQGTYLRRFGAAGAPLGPEVQIAADASGPPTLAIAPDGTFLVVWRDWDARTATAHIRGRRFGRAGVPSSVELEIDSRPIASSGTPSVAATPDGGFLVAWDRCDPANVEEGCEVRLRRFDAQDEPTTADDVTISPDDDRRHEWPAVAAAPTGHAAVAWQSCDFRGGNPTGNCRIETLFFDPAGQRALAPHSVVANSNLMRAWLAAGGSSFVVSFDASSCHAAGCQSTFPNGAYAQRYRIPRPRPSGE